MRRVRRRDSLGREMPADVEVGGIFPLFDNLVVLFGFANRVLLRANVVSKTFVARLVFAAHFCHVLLDRGKFFVGGGEFFLGHAGSVRAPKPRANKFGAFFWQTRPARADGGG